MEACPFHSVIMLACHHCEVPFFINHSDELSNESEFYCSQIWPADQTQSRL